MAKKCNAMVLLTFRITILTTFVPASPGVSGVVFLHQKIPGFSSRRNVHNASRDLHYFLCFPVLHFCCESVAVAKAGHCHCRNSMLAHVHIFLMQKHQQSSQILFFSFVFMKKDG